MPTGHLGTFSFGGTAGCGTGLNIISIEPPEEEVGTLALPYLGLAKGSYMPYEAMELIEGGEYVLTLADDNDVQVVDDADASSGATFKKIIREAATCIWVKPVKSPNTGGAQRSFSGILTKHKESTQQTGERNTITLTVKVAGNVTKTAGT